MKKLLLFGAIALSINAFGQSKKEQIVALNYSIDSLNTVLSTARDKSAEEVNGLNTTIQGLYSENAQLKGDVSKLESSTNKLTKDNEKFKTDLEEMSKKNLELEGAIRDYAENDDYRGTDGNIQSLHSFSKNYESINAWDVSYLKFQKYPLPNSKQDIIQWLKQFEVSSETNVVYDYDVDPEDWKGVTGMDLTCYKNGIILQKISGYENLNIRLEFPFLSVNDAKLLFKQFNLLELAPGCLEEDDLDVKFKYSQEIKGTMVYFGNGC
mgnify:CR=1 FL=1